jgi:hypothetical protein
MPHFLAEIHRFHRCYLEDLGVDDRLASSVDGAAQTMVYCVVIGASTDWLEDYVSLIQQTSRRRRVLKVTGSLEVEAGFPLGRMDEG